MVNDRNIPSDNEDQSESFGSLSDGDLANDNDEEITPSDTWIEELECALLADCDLATLKKICEGKRIPDSLRPDYWRALLALCDSNRVKLTNEYDLPNQKEIRNDCEQLVDELIKEQSVKNEQELESNDNESKVQLDDGQRLRLLSDLESTITTYVKARPELSYVSGNGWTDILKVLHHLRLNDTQLYQMFFRIVDRYIPRDLSPYNDNKNLSETETGETKHQNNGSKTKGSKISTTKKPTEFQISRLQSKSPDHNHTQQATNSAQAYHLLRLLIQYHDPELCSMLDSKKVTPNLYVRDWFCSLFARNCTSKLALYIWDMHFKMADPFLIFFAAIVMVANASDELKSRNMNQAEMLDVLNSMPSKLEEDDIEDLYYLVSNHYTNSTPRSIRSYSHLLFMDTFGSTYSGNESPDESASIFDLKTTRLTYSLDLSQYLCLPIVPAEIFAQDSVQQRSSPTSQSSSSLRYFLVDCRPAEQYNAGHLKKAFHLDCSLMLREPSSFATAVQALLEIQRQVVASKSNTGGQHLCFIGSGQEEEDQYVNMVVASFLQKYQKYVSVVFGGFDAIHDYVQTKSELKSSFESYIVDHDEALCKSCSPKQLDAPKGRQETGTQQSANPFGSSAQSIFASTTSFFKGDKSNLPGNAITRLTSNPQASKIAESGASMFDKFASAFVTKSSVLKEKLVETLNTTTVLPTSPLAAAGSTAAQSTRSHVSEQDKLGPRYKGSSGSMQYAVDDLDNLRSGARKSGTEAATDEPCQEVQIEAWQRDNKIITLHKCAQIKGNIMYPGYVALNRTHLWILREIPHNKGFAIIAAKRPLDMVVKITSKRRQPDFIVFRYGYAANNSPSPSPLPNQPVDGATSQSDNKRRSDASSTDLGVGQLPEPQTKDKQDGNASVTEAKSLPTIIASDHLHIPQAFELIRLIKREIVRIMDENSTAARQDQEAT